MLADASAWVEFDRATASRVATIVSVDLDDPSTLA
jgi:hypothetical protein